MTLNTLHFAGLDVAHVTGNYREAGVNYDDRSAKLDFALITDRSYPTFRSAILEMQQLTQVVKLSYDVIRSVVTTSIPPTNTMNEELTAGTNHLISGPHFKPSSLPIPYRQRFKSAERAILTAVSIITSLTVNTHLAYLPIQWYCPHKFSEAT